ncbi:hypothetical protein HDU97_000369 [Phlyctochytrium planicorne]|nr:hypothetical protein HDU97_000369 [Phlyctochytrium planicorne]
MPPKQANAVALLQQAQKAVDACRPDLAIKFLDRALEKEPDHVQVLEALGIVHMEISVAAAAVEQDQEAAMESVEEASGKAYMYFHKAIELDPNVVGSAAYLYLGQLAEGQDSVRYYEVGIQRLESEAEGLESNSQEYQVILRKIVSALCSMTEIYMTDCCELPEAESLCEQYMQKALSLDSENAEVLQTLASVRLSQCRPEDARNALEKAVGLWISDGVQSPQWPTYDQRIACSKLLLELGLHDVATQVLQTCQEENDTDPEGWYLFGWCYYRMGGGDAGTADQEIAAGIGKSIEGNFDADSRGELWSDAKECLDRLIELESVSDAPNADMLDHARDILKKIESYLTANPPNSNAVDDGEEIDGNDDDDEIMEG